MTSVLRARMRISAPLAAAICLVLGCRDNTGPRDHLTVSLSVIGTPTQSITVAGGAHISCDVTLGATISGPGTVVWRDGVLRIFAGVDRTKALDSLPVSATDVQQGWSTQQAGAAHPQMGIRLSASVPFETEVEFRYMDTASADTGAVRTRFACGPVPPVGGVRAPTISNVTVTPSTGEIQAGESFTVTYTATSPFALWNTAIRITGPYTVTRDSAADGTTNLTRAVRFVVPAGAQRGVPLGVNVIVQDAALQQSAQYVQTQTVIVDRTPPVLLDARVFAGPPGITGQFAVGDPLQVMVSGRDNEALSWLVWELSGSSTFRDSMPVSGPSGFWMLSPTVRPEWVGTGTMSVYLRDGEGLKSNVVSSPANGLRFYPLVTHPATTPVWFTWPGAAMVTLGDFVYDAKRNVFYVVLTGTPGIAVLDVATMTLRTPITLSAPATSLDLSPSGDSLIVAIQSTRSLGVVNLAQPASSEAMISLTALDTAGALNSITPPRPGLIRVAANGKVIVTLTTATRSGARVVDVDLASGVQRVRSDARSVNAEPAAGMTTTRDRSRLIIYDSSCPRSYLAATDAFTTCALYPNALNANAGITVDTAGQRISLGNSAFTVDFTRLRDGGTINGAAPTSAISPDGASLYLGVPNIGVTTMRIADGTLLERFRVPIAPARMFAAAGGDWLMVFGGSPASAVRVDLK